MSRFTKGTDGAEVTFVDTLDVQGTLFEDYLFGLGVEPWYVEQPEYFGCECEIDWTCPPCRAAGRFGGYTFIETRYDGRGD